ncbi:hypothetical protein [Nitrosopumilus sp.]|uniref:hypothetical protein n=1 Tax=Nitrosopumilus sp. TaxID=2024843 RepID=UPI00292D1682|nr:hypothetical protein [Nitrosopumilus sp.]
MSTYNIQEKVSENTKTKLGVIGLIALPIAAAMYSADGSIAASLEQVPQILTSGAFPIGFTLFSWGIAAKLTMKLRK